MCAACVAGGSQVLAPEYGPFVVRQMEGSDYVAVLRRGGRPVSAVVMDCFGQQGCCVDLLSTLPEARNQVRSVPLSTIAHLTLALAFGGAA